MGNENDLKKKNKKITPQEIENLKDKNYKNIICNLLDENNQLKSLCGQYQLMIQAQNFNQNLNNNIINSWINQVNNFINAINFNNIGNNMNNNNFSNNSFNNNNFGFNSNFNNFNSNNNFHNNFNNIFQGNINNNSFQGNINNNSFQGNIINNNNFQGNINNNNTFNNINNFNNGNNILNILNNKAPDEKLMNIIFHFESGKKCPIVTVNSCRLKYVFNLVLVQLWNEDYSFDLRNTKFVHNSQDVSRYFLNNDKVSSLKLPMNSTSTIEVIGLRNLH